MLKLEGNVLAEDCIAEDLQLLNLGLIALVLCRVNLLETELICADRLGRVNFPTLLEACSSIKVGQFILRLSHPDLPLLLWSLQWLLGLGFQGFLGRVKACRLLTVSWWWDVANHDSIPSDTEIVLCTVLHVLLVFVQFGLDESLVHLFRDLFRDFGVFLGL